MKVSIITAVLNGKDYMPDCIESVLVQDYADIEYIVVDGASTDGTIEVVQKYAHRLNTFVSEKDDGFYDALNKGIQLATGDIVGQLNSDDVLAGPSVISRIVKEFKLKGCEAVYGNLNYTSRNDLNRIVRQWKSAPFCRKFFENGWMVPHPALYMKRSIYQCFGSYNVDFRSSADYELMLRLFYKRGVSAVYVDELFVKMRMGGMGNSGWKQLLKVFVQDYQALAYHSVRYPLTAVMIKKIRKVTQFFGSHRKDIIKKYLTQVRRIWVLLRNN